MDQWFSDSSFLEIPIFNLLFNLFSDMTVQFTCVPSFLPSLPHNVKISKQEINFKLAI